MGDFVGYNGSSIFTPHPKTVLEDGYVGVGPGGTTVVAYSSNTNPAALTSLPPNSLLKSIAHSGTGVWTFTFKQFFPRLLFTNMVTICPVGSSAAVLGTQLTSVTVGQNSATNTTLPVVVYQVNNAGTPAELNGDTGFYFCFVLQNASVY